MTDRSPVDILKSQAHAIAVDRDVDAFLAHFAPNCLFRDMTEPRPRVGHQELRDYMQAYLEVMSDMEIEYLTLFGDDEFALAEFVLHGLYRGDGAVPGGTRVALHYCAIDQIRDGLVQSETSYSVPQELERQLASAARALDAS
jgi:hypothetical protein